MKNQKGFTVAGLLIVTLAICIAVIFVGLVLRLEACDEFGLRNVHDHGLAVPFVAHRLTVLEAFREQECRWAKSINDDRPKVDLLNTDEALKALADHENRSRVANLQCYRAFIARKDAEQRARRLGF